MATLKPLPAARGGLGAAVSGGLIWLVGGVDARDVSVPTVWAYKPGQGVVKRSTLPFKIHDLALAAVPQGIDILGGGRAASLDTFGRLSVPSIHYTTLGRLPLPLSDLWAGTFAGRLTVLGGPDAGAPSPIVWQYDTGRIRFTTFARLPYGVRYPAVAQAGGDLIVIGGLGKSQATDGIFAVTPTGTVRRIGTLPHPLYRAAAATMGNSVYLFGGTNGKTATDAIERINPTTGRVTSAGTLPAPWAYGAAVASGGDVYLFGGNNGKAAVSSVYRVSLGAPAS